MTAPTPPTPADIKRFRDNDQGEILGFGADRLGPCAVRRSEG